MTRKLIAFSVLVTIHTGAIQAEPITVRGSGIVSCGEWTRERSISNSQAAQMHANWIIGYVVGVRMTDQRDWGGTVGNAGLLAWIDNYCRTEPLNSLVQASVALVNELRAR